MLQETAVADKPRDAFVQMSWRGWPKKHAPPHTSYYAELGRSALKGVDIDTEAPQKMRSPGTLLSWGESMGGSAGTAGTAVRPLSRLADFTAGLKQIVA